MKKFVITLPLLAAVFITGCATDCGRSTASWSVACGVKHSMGMNSQTQGYLDEERAKAEAREAQVAGAQERAQRLSSKLQNAQAELAALEQSSSPLRKKAAALREELGKKQSEIDLIQQDVNDLKLQLDKLNAKKDKSAQDWARRETLLNELKKQQNTINKLDRYVEQQLLSRAAEILRNG